MGAKMNVGEGKEDFVGNLDHVGPCGEVPGHSIVRNVMGTTVS